MSGKGLELERLVANLFKAKGYDVRHNVKMRGRSRVEHQIDVYAEYKAPLHVSKIIIECKSYDKPIDKDIVIKLIHVVQDLGVDKGILVTTSYFTPDAVSIAQGFNVELWDYAKLRELLGEVPIEEHVVLTNVFYVDPAIPSDKAMKIIDSTLKGIFGKKGSIEGSSLIFYPYYEVDIDAKIQEFEGLIKKITEERVISAKILVDAVTGTLCDYDPGTGVLGIVNIPSLSEEERKAFQILLRARALSADMLASLLSCSTAKARKLLQGLVVKGVARVLSGRQTVYVLGVDIPDPSRLRSFPHTMRVKSGEPKDGIKVEASLSLERVESSINLLWEGVIKSYKTVFYPYYVSKITKDGKKYCKAVDMLTKNMDERISNIFTSMYLNLPF
jgi:predicted small secreted protein